MASTTAKPLEELFAAVNLSAYSPEEQEQIVLDLSGTLFEGTLVRLIERMDDATRDDFNALMKSDADSEEVVAFLRERVSGSDEVIQEVVRAITKDVAQLTGLKITS